MKIKEIREKEVERKLQGDIRIEGFKQIKPETEITPEECKAFWDNFWNAE